MLNKDKHSKVRVGDLLVEKNIISEDQLQQALDEQKRSGRKLGRAIIDLGFVNEDDLLMELSSHFAMPFMDISRFQFDSEITRRLPEGIARRYRAIVLVEEEYQYFVGFVDPLDILAVDEVKRILKKNVVPAFVKEQELLNAIDRIYRRTEQIASLVGELDEELGESDVDLATILAESDASEAPVVRLLQNIFEDAVQVSASDIHIEPDESVLRVRLRIDGELQEQVMKEKRVVSALVSRLKIMSGLDISEKRLPQDGRFNIRILNHSVDVRLSTLPTQYGEAVVMRLLDQSQGLLDINSLGMTKHVRDRFKTLITRPHGMVLVTGPTGSGKSTTLYAALNSLNAKNKKIITAEDPVEYRLPRINQVQVNAKVGLNFARILRTALRQDPDIILIGEMRDTETMEIGLRAAMTGHLVLSTLHTNDAISSAMRLMDMGADSYLVASSLRAVIGQRLVRKLCQNCKQVYEPNEQEKNWLRGLGEEPGTHTFYHGEGCTHCSNTGYVGRTGVYELLELDDAMLDALRRNDLADFSRLAKESDLYMPLAECALEYAITGRTSISEVFKISASLDDSALSIESLR
ncbi:Flp pilus assembly complex ATPase component TadA [Bermanella marisrubri]|uniref:Type II secretory pathway, ATPase PulE/Tfp pilus assembly pathway, ATPase PilB n=1 Tax=Bermanella marisrubri TaxID=207949 RepID=Q1N2G2_9GAMM|nr:GspE/PulE family protein [Bermanella marisrubri]EAT12445.1 Type II secretory pathway, ATPase PulE/Tfp pilus assembly pathway, ATPase PilB [Oceanobacter sp. RED65] [Bermanella marisrubri]QIZ85524.1 Flp pilus assembly complex ATPase component TadA [Bermanella marisrubri]